MYLFKVYLMKKRYSQCCRQCCRYTKEHRSREDNSLQLFINSCFRLQEHFVLAIVKIQNQSLNTFRRTIQMLQLLYSRSRWEGKWFGESMICYFTLSSIEGTHLKVKSNIHFYIKLEQNYQRTKIGDMSVVYKRLIIKYLR